MRSHLIFRVLVALAVAVAFAMAGRSGDSPPANARPPVAAAGETPAR